MDSGLEQLPHGDDSHVNSFPSVDRNPVRALRGQTAATVGAPGGGRGPACSGQPIMVAQARAYTGTGLDRAGRLDPPGRGSRSTGRAAYVVAPRRVRAASCRRRRPPLTADVRGRTPDQVWPSAHVQFPSGPRTHHYPWRATHTLGFQPVQRLGTPAADGRPATGHHVVEARWAARDGIEDVACLIVRSPAWRRRDRLSGEAGCRAGGSLVVGASKEDAQAVEHILGVANRPGSVVEQLVAARARRAVYRARNHPHVDATGDGRLGRDQASARLRAIRRRRPSAPTRR